MAQQINLYSPILLAPKRHFSALAMAQALGVLTLGLAGLGGWSILATDNLRRDFETATQADEQERERLTALAPAPAEPKDVAALEQELAQAQKTLLERRQMFNELTAGLNDPERSNSSLLRLLAQTVPAPVWLTEVRLVDGRLELAGMTLQPEALRPWLARLSAHPAVAAQSLRAVKVERSEAGGATETWSFRVVSGPVPGEPS